MNERKALAPISIKLRCASWAQLASIYKRDLARGAMFLKSASPPPIGTPVKIDLTLPSESLVPLSGAIARHVKEGELDGRGPGVDIQLDAIPQSAMWLIETALSSAPAAKAAPAARPAPRESSIGDGADLAAAETELLVALTTELDSLRRLNPFQVLGLGYDATDDHVRQAFGELTRRYHPDRYARFQSPDLRHLAAEIFILIRDAYRRIGKESSRVQALAQLGRKEGSRVVSIPPKEERADAPPAPRPPIPPVPRPAAAPAPRPVVHVPPLPAPKPAPPAPPAPVDARSGDLSMAEGMLGSGKYDEALSFFRVLLRRNPGDRQAKAGIELAEGLRALAMRDRLEAAQRFEAVLEIDPANERAARELAEMRRLATTERKGMLSRLLGKKE